MSDFKQMLACANTETIFLIKTEAPWRHIPDGDQSDINFGWCHDWARNVLLKIPSAKHCLYGDEVDSGHSFLLIADRFYDADCHDGVEDWMDLPIFKMQLESIKPCTRSFGFKIL